MDKAISIIGCLVEDLENAVDELHQNVNSDCCEATPCQICLDLKSANDFLKENE